jgi:hypothetical protein
MVKRKIRWIKNEPLPPVKRGEVEPPRVFRKLYRPLGAIVVTFADLEDQLTRTLYILLGSSWREGAALEWLMQSANNRIELFYFLAMRATELDRLANTSKREEAIIHGAQTLRESAETIYGEMQQANSDRNNLLHGAWTGLSVDGLSTYSKDRLKIDKGKLSEIPMRGISLQLLKEEADYIISVNMRLTDWTARLQRLNQPHLWPAPLPDKFALRSPLGRLLHANRNAARQRPPPASRG